ncbi:MAG: hypothetical protein Q8M26_08890 [Pseudolabrys sp.]|nr:hypothetical protein [Pseudolabrys sp.]
MGQQLGNEPVYIAGQSLNDIWVDGIQLIERVDAGVYRIPLFRERMTTDKIRYREPVVQLLCSRSRIPDGLRQVWDALAGRNDFNRKMLS